MANSVKNINFILINKHPEKVVEHYLAASAVNSAAIAADIPWDEAFSGLIAQSHEFCLMPVDERCIKGMLRSVGFIQQPTYPGRYSLEDIRAHMTQDCTSGAAAVVKTHLTGSRNQMSAVIPVTENGVTTYKIAGFSDRSRGSVVDIWLRWPDGQDHSPIHRRRGASGKRARAYRTPVENANYKYHQENPDNRYIGDCLVRACSTAFGTTWHETVDLLSKYRRTAVNSFYSHQSLLKERGFVRREAPMHNGKYFNGIEFCIYAGQKYTKGEPIFAYVGKSHAAAIMPLEYEKGKYRYRIMDTWDSSGRQVIEYWVLPAKKDAEAKSAAQDMLKSGDSIGHPTYGKGKIVKLNGDKAEIDFGSAGLKKLSCAWIREHCNAA